MADEETGYDQQNNVSTPSSSANDKIYEPKNKRKIIRLLTVFAYVFFVSLAAIILSLYYIILWNPEYKHLSGARGLGVPEKRIQTETQFPEIVNEHYRKKEITERKPNTFSSYKLEEEKVLPNKTRMQIQENTPNEVILMEEPDTPSSNKILLVQEEDGLPNKTPIQENTYIPTEVIMTGEPGTTSSYRNPLVQEDTTTANQDRIQGDPTPKEAHAQGDTITPVEDHRNAESFNEKLGGETRGKFTGRVDQLATTLLTPDHL